jgi:hypothetical protein
MIYTHVLTKGGLLFELLLMSSRDFLEVVLRVHRREWT